MHHLKIGSLISNQNWSLIRYGREGKAKKREKKKRERDSRKQFGIGV
jgi:hypothetical protein